MSVTAAFMLCSSRPVAGSSSRTMPCAPPWASSPSTAARPAGPGAVVIRRGSVPAVRENRREREVGLSSMPWAAIASCAASAGMVSATTSERLAISPARAVRSAERRVRALNAAEPASTRAITASAEASTLTVRKRRELRRSAVFSASARRRRSSRASRTAARKSLSRWERSSSGRPASSGRSAASTRAESGAAASPSGRPASSQKVA